MSLRYTLTGTFIEACNCTVICPCWVDDTPSEDYCAGLFAWHLGAGSTIEGIDVSGGNVVSVTVHGDSRRGGESTSALYVDDVPDEAVAHLLRAFSGRGGGHLAQLARVTGDVVDEGRAQIAITTRGETWEVALRSRSGGGLVRVAGASRHFDGAGQPLRLTDTALHRELGIGDHPVEASGTSALSIDVAALPGAPVDVRGRSGMTGPFAYAGTGNDAADLDADLDGAAAEPTDAGAAGGAGHAG